MTQTDSVSLGKVAWGLHFDAGGACKVVQRTIILNRNPAGIAVQEDRTVQPGSVYLRVKQPRRLP